MQRELISKILTKGGTISFPYKTNEKDLVHELKIYLFSGYYSKSYIVIDWSEGNIKYPTEQMDKAIDHFVSMFESPNNLMYGRQEVLCALSEKGEHLNLENPSNLKRLMELVDNFRKEKTLP